MTKRSKQPWNPFPLKSLKVMDVSPCAKIVLIYLAARSDWKGQTCVGVRTISRELMKSQRFVINGLKELRDKGYMTQSLRDRREKEADWKTLTKKVLEASDALGSSEADALDGDSSGASSSTSGEANAPFTSANVEAEPSSIKKSPNLADQNLAGFEVSYLVSECKLPDLEKEKATPVGFSSEDKGNTKNNPVPTPTAAEMLSVLYPDNAQGQDGLPAKANSILAGEPRALDYLRWNRAHKTGGLVIRSLDQLEKALATGYGFNDWYAHLEAKGAECKACQRLRREAELREAETTPCVVCGKLGGDPNYFDHCAECWREQNIKGIYASNQKAARSKSQSSDGKRTPAIPKPAKPLMMVDGKPLPKYRQESGQRNILGATCPRCGDIPDPECPRCNPVESEPAPEPGSMEATMQQNQAKAAAAKAPAPGSIAAAFQDVLGSLNAPAGFDEEEA